MSGLMKKVKGALGKHDEEHMGHSNQYGTQGAAGLTGHHSPASGASPLSPTFGGSHVSSSTGHHNARHSDSAMERRTQEAAAQEAAATGQPAMAQTVTTAVAAPVFQQGQEAVCGQDFFTKTEDRPIVRERVEFIKEHRPLEKEYVVETRATGVERELVEGRIIEHLGTTERVVSVAQPKGPCE